MSPRYKCKKLLCCCVTVKNYSEKHVKKKAYAHSYCGCKESRKQRSKMKSCDVDRTTLIDEEVFEAIDYDFVNQENEKCLIESPEIPLSHNLTSGLHPKSDIIIQGTINKNAIRFAINLAIGRNEKPDIAFHLNPRFDQLYSARNSRFEGCWGHEEGNSQLDFPFKRGQQFYIQLFLTHSEFLVAVNGVHYCSYTYRTPLINITTLQVEGDVSVSLVHIHSAPDYPSSLPPDLPDCPFQFPLLSNTITNNNTQTTPVYAILEENLKANSVIQISGMVKQLPISFYINLQDGKEVWPHPEIPLHISVRFNQGGEHVILANTWHQDGWGREQMAHSNCFFTPGNKFKLQITCQEDGFVSEVDNQPLLTFKHRVPYSSINTLHIQGDVFIYSITLN